MIDLVIVGIYLNTLSVRYLFVLFFFSLQTLWLVCFDVSFIFFDVITWTKEHWKLDVTYTVSYDENIYKHVPTLL